MRLFTLLILSFVLHKTLLSQSVANNFPLLYANDTTKNSIHINTDNFYNSNAVNNKFISFFTRGGFIDSLTKAQASNKLKASNNIGAEISVDNRYYLHNSIALGKANWGYYFNAAYFEYYSSSFSENLFNLIFWGNKQFAGKNIQLADFNFTAIKAQKIGLGIYNKNSFSSVNLNFYNISSYKNYNVTNAVLFTEENGQQITLNINENITLTDTLQRKLLSDNGWGLGTDIIINLNTGKNRSATIDDAFTFRIENFGFGVLNANTLQQHADTIINYTGFQVNNILNTDNLIPINLTDTINFNYRRRPKTILLPFTLTIGKIPSRFTKNKVESFYGIRYRYASNYKPLFYAGVFIRATTKLHYSLNLQTGGYGNFNVSLQIDYKPVNTIWISLGCSNMAGTIFKNLNGKALNGSIYVAF